MLTAISTFCFHFFRAPLLDVPRTSLPNPSENAAWYPDCWVLYPKTHAPVRIHMGHHFKAVAELRILQNSIASVAFAVPGTRSQMTLAKAREFHHELMSWYEGLGDMLTVRSAVLPFQLVMQYVHHTLLFGSRPGS